MLFRSASSPAATTTATIANGPPAVNAGPDQTVAVGSPVTLHATFSDGGTDAPWAYAIDWGDGSSPTTGSTSSPSSPITASHSYSAAGTNTVRVTVTDKDGAAGSGTLTVTVSSQVVTLVGAGNSSLGSAGPATISGTSLTLNSITGTPTATATSVTGAYVAVVGP